MPKFCANLTWLFTELPFLERFEAAKEAGFDGVEVLFPYDVNAQDIVNARARHDLQMVLINCPPPNYTGGAQGFAAVPGVEERFQKDFMRALRYAQTLGAKHLHIMSGVAEGALAKETFIRNLRWAAAQAPKQSLTIEPINNETMPGYFLNDFDLGREIVMMIGAPNLRLQFDAFHAAKITGTSGAHGRPCAISRRMCRSRKCRTGANRIRARSTILRFLPRLMRRGTQVGCRVSISRARQQAMVWGGLQVDDTEVREDGFVDFSAPTLHNPNSFDNLFPAENMLTQRCQQGYA
jgi:2-dehydrotetronate isomerase